MAKRGIRPKCSSGLRRGEPDPAAFPLEHCRIVLRVGIHVGGRHTAADIPAGGVDEVGDLLVGQPAIAGVKEHAGDREVKGDALGPMTPAAHEEIPELGGLVDSLLGRQGEIFAQDLAVQAVAPRASA